MTVIVGDVPPKRPLEKTHWTPSPPVSTDTLTVDFAPTINRQMPSDEDLLRISYLPPHGCDDLIGKIKKGKDFESYLPAHGYYDSGLWSDWAYNTDVIDDFESEDDDVNGFDEHHADVEGGKGWKCRLPGPGYHDDPISLYDIDYENSIGADQADLLTPSTDTTPDGEYGLPPPGYDPQTGRRLCDFPGTQDHCECPNPWASYDSEDPYTEYCDTYKQGVPSLTASSNRGASSRPHASSRSETAQVCSLLLLLLIVLLTLGFLNNYLYHRTLAALRRRREQENDSSSGSKGKLSQAEPQAETYHAKFRANADHEDHENGLKHLASSFFVTLGHLFGALLFLSTTRDGDDAVQDACIILGTATFIWLGVNTIAVFNVIGYERPSWAVPILDHINAFFDAVGKLFGQGYAKICNAFLSVAWHLAFAIMLMAFTMLMLADAVMKSLSGSTGNEAASKQDHHAASKKQGKGNEHVEAEASIKAQSEPVWLTEKAVNFEAPPKINPWRKPAEEERAKAKSIARALKQSCKEAKVEPASGLDEWEIIEK